MAPSNGPSNGGSHLAGEQLFRLGFWILAAERDGRRIVVQLVQADVEQIVEQQQEDARRGDLGASVLGRQMLLQKVVQPHALEQALEDGERSDRVRDERCAVVRVSSSSGRGVAGLSC